MRLALEEILSLTRPDLGSFVRHTGPGRGRETQGTQHTVYRASGKGGKGSNNKITHKYEGYRWGFVNLGRERRIKGSATHNLRT